MKSLKVIDGEKEEYFNSLVPEFRLMIDVVKQGFGLKDSDFRLADKEGSPLEINIPKKIKHRSFEIKQWESFLNVLKNRKVSKMDEMMGELL